MGTYGSNMRAVGIISYLFVCLKFQQLTQKLPQGEFLTDIPHLNFTIGVILHKLHRLAKICFLQTPDTSDFDELATF